MTRPIDLTASHPGSTGADTRRSWPMIFLRYVIPLAIVLGGLVIMALGGEVDLEGGAGIVSAGLAVFALNWLYRVSFYGDIEEREAEEAARVYFAEHGHWPDQVPTTSARMRSRAPRKPTGHPRRSS